MNRENEINVLLEALELSPENFPLRKHLADVLAESGKNEEALAEYEKALLLQKGDSHALLGISSSLFKLGKSEEAGARLKELLSADPQNGEGLRLMARILLSLDQKDGARDYYSRAIKIEPGLADPNLEKDLFEKPAPAKISIPASHPPEAHGNSEQPAEDMMLEMEAPSLKFSDVGGMEDLKEEIRLNIIYPFQHPEMYAAYGKKIGGGILLYGPPGCGKTYIARATAGECNARFVAVGIEDVLNMWMGESERKLHALFEAARSYPAAILFFDEIEAFAGNRADMKHSPHYRVLVNQFLAEMDGAKGSNQNLMIIGATNSPWHVDSAFRRPGRFDKVVFVPPPDLIARIEILKIHCSSKPVENLDYERIAKQMKRFSGADIQAVCDGAAEIGLKETLKTGKIRKLKTDDFLKVLKSVHPTTDEWLATAKNYATYSNQSGLYTPLVEYFQKSKD